MIYRQRISITGLIILLLLLCSIKQTHAKSALTWQSLAPGLDYTEVKQQTVNPWAHYHIFKINLKHYTLELALAQDIHQAAATVKQLATQTNAWITINGGFFSPQLKPLGLRIQRHKIKQALKNISWWGVFYTDQRKPGQARIVSPRRFRYAKTINFAIQGGPRLVINGRIPKLKAGLAERSAIGVNKKGQVMLVVTHHSPISTYQLASFMAHRPESGGLGCTNALNLDGGSSSQLYADVGDFKLSVSGFAAVTDAIIVKPKRA